MTPLSQDFHPLVSPMGNETGQYGEAHTTILPCDIQRYGERMQSGLGLESPEQLVLYKCI